MGRKDDRFRSLDRSKSRGHVGLLRRLEESLPGLMGLALSAVGDSSHIALDGCGRTSGSGGGGGGRWTYRPGGIFLITPRLCAVQGIVDTLSTRSLS